MKNAGDGAKLLDASYAPEAEALLDELERSGQFRIGLDAELDDEPVATSADYSWGRGSGSVVIQDWWTSNSLALRVGPGIAPQDVVLGRVDDSLQLRTADGLDRVVLEGYLGLIPDASTLRIVFHDATEWTGAAIVTRIVTRLRQEPAAESGSH